MNKYLEKIASISMAVPMAIGAASAKKGDRVGGAASGVAGGIVGGAAGALLGTVGGAKLHDIPLINVSAKHHVRKIAPSIRAGTALGVAGGAYLGGKAYSRFKHRNDY